MLGLLEFKVTLGPLTGLLGIGLGIFSIFGFVVLGMRTLYFFEPSILVPTIHRRMENAIQRALAGRFRWRDSSFQNHWQKQADAAFETYGDLVDVVVKDGNASSAALVELASELTRLGRIYARHKARIPSDSFWFKRAARQKKFLQTSSFAVDIALATDTGLPPDSVPDRDWFERRTAQLLRRLVKVLVERNDFAGLTTVVERMRATVDTCDWLPSRMR